MSGLHRYLPSWPPSYLHQLLHMLTQGDPVRLGCHARGPLHHQGRFEGGGWLGQGQRGTVSQCVGCGWWSGAGGHFSPDSWGSGAPGRKKAHRSHPPCRRDPGKAGGGQDVTDPCPHPPHPPLRPAPCRDPHSHPLPQPLFSGDSQGPCSHQATIQPPTSASVP